jgi:hypothetical protein
VSVGVTVTTSPSTPFGANNVTVQGTDGFVIAASDFQLGVGDLSLNIAPTTIVVGPSGNTYSSATTGLNEQLNITCTGLPAGAQCGTYSNFYTSAPSASFSVDHDSLVARYTEGSRSSSDFAEDTAAGGMIGAPQGAAARLGLKRTTLVSKMKRFGIYGPRCQRLVGEFNEGSELPL